MVLGSYSFPSNLSKTWQGFDMTFETAEKSRYQGKPITLYLFQYGPEADHYYGYTDAESVITDPSDGKEYFPLPITRGSITASGTLDKAALEIRTPRTADLAELFRVYPPSQVVSATLKQGHLGQAPYMVVWLGRVLNCTREGSEAIFSCEPVSTSLRRPGLRRNYQLGCPHWLYGPQCQANKVAATSTHSVVSIAGTIVTLAANWADPHLPAKYYGGMIEWTTAGGETEIRTILTADATTISAGGLLRGLEVGMSLDVILGCSHLLDDCENLHNNILNYGGQWLIPIKNPYGNSSVFL